MQAVRRHLLPYLLLLTVAFLLAVPVVLHGIRSQTHPTAVIGQCVGAYVDDTGATVCLP